MQSPHYATLYLTPALFKTDNNIECLIVTPNINVGVSGSGRNDWMSTPDSLYIITPFHSSV